MAAMSKRLGSVFHGTSAAAVPFLVFASAATYDLLIQRTDAVGCVNVLAFAARGIRFGLFAAALALFFGKYVRCLYFPAWVWFTIVLFFQTLARCGYSTVLDGCWIMLVWASSWREMRECTGIFSPCFSWTFGVSSLVLFAIGCRFLWRTAYPRISRRTVLIGLLTALPFILFDVSPLARFGATDAFLTLRLPMDTLKHHEAYRKFVDAARNPRFSPFLRLTVPSADAPLGVIVVGESATRRDWELYGYERPTTPRLSALSDELAVFTDPTSTHDSTGLSLQMVFTDATCENPTDFRCLFAQKCSAVGYACCLFSAQTRWSRWDGVEKFLFTGCGETWYMNEQTGPRDGGSSYDDALAAPVLKRLACTRKGEPTLLFVHLLGSHFDPVERYPTAKAFFPRYFGDVAPGVDAETMPWNVMACDHYDNSIRFTDSVLGDLIEGLRKVGRPSYLVYFSDHGESPRARSWRFHGDPDLAKVPLVVWFSSEYRQRFPHVVADIMGKTSQPLRLDRLQTVLLPLACISDTADR